MSIIYDENNIDTMFFDQNQDFIVQPSLKSLVSSTKYLNNKVHKYKSEKAKIKQIEHDIYENDGQINTGSITLHQGSTIEYEITDETDPKSLVPKQYVDDHMNIDVNNTLHLKDNNVSLETDGTIIIHKDTNGIISSGDVIIQDSNDDEAIKLTNTGTITANNLIISQGTITKIPKNENDIVNKSYVDNKFSDDYLSKNNSEEQTVNGPVNFNNTTKILVLSLPVIDG